MITFSNTIVTEKTYLNLNLVKAILFDQYCNDDVVVDDEGSSTRCFVIFFSDNSVYLVSRIETIPDYVYDLPHRYDSFSLPSQITWKNDLSKNRGSKTLPFRALV